MRYEVARQLAGEGVKVIVSARELDRGVPLSIKLKNEGLDVLPIVLNILDESSIANAVREIENRYGKLDSLVNNAGGFYDEGGTPLRQTSSSPNSTSVYSL